MIEHSADHTLCTKRIKIRSFTYEHRTITIKRNEQGHRSVMIEALTIYRHNLSSTLQRPLQQSSSDSHSTSRNRQSSSLRQSSGVHSHFRPLLLQSASVCSPQHTPFQFPFQPSTVLAWQQ